jgi:outer membrane protein assembly factor BamB
MLYAVDTETGEPQWEIEHEHTGGPWIEATVAKDSVYFVTNPDTGHIRAYEPTDGSIAWKQTTGVSTGASLAVSESTIFIVG